MEETQSILCLQRGDVEITERLFEELYEKYALKALRTAYLITGNRQLAEDILQESFVQCYTQIQTLKEPDKFQAWFYRILIRMSWRFQARERRKFNSEPLDDNLGGQQVDNSADVEERLEISETHKKLNQAVQQLSRPLQEAVILYYFNELSIKEMAAVLGCFENTVKTRLYKARKKLKLEMESCKGVHGEGDESREGIRCL